MNGVRWLAVAFVLALGGVSGGYMMWQTYAPPVSASRPVMPQERQFSMVMTRIGSEEGTQFLRWIPATVVVHAGDTVVLRVTNGDPDGAHGFGLAGAGIFIQEIPSGKTVTVRFVAAQAGIYFFSCVNSACARDHAYQTGQLIVLGTP